jgi:diketogulonate reductase-like aldo/keto reductase
LRWSNRRSSPQAAKVSKFAILIRHRITPIPAWPALSFSSLRGALRCGVRLGSGGQDGQWRLGRPVAERAGRDRGRPRLGFEIFGAPSFAKFSCYRTNAPQLWLKLRVIVAWLGSARSDWRMPDAAPELPNLGALPSFMYGTAWKEDRTASLTRLALQSGFRAIDTANQRMHYFEAGVGAALREAQNAGEISRSELFLQSKFTSLSGQDERLPYERTAPIGEQVAQSFESSLVHLGTDYLDSYVLHGPSARRGLALADWQAWRAMEALAQAGKVRFLGISNVSLEQLQALSAGAAIQPKFVQNRCYAKTGWDRTVRTFCNARGWIYQGFSLLTANRVELAGPVAQRIAVEAGRPIAQVVFRFCQLLGMLPLTGTSQPEHMRLDLAASEFDLSPPQIAALENLHPL